MLDIVVVRDKGLVREVYVVDENGGFRRVSHRPWFVLGARGRVAIPYKYDVEPVDYEVMVFDEASMSYRPSGAKAYVVRVGQPREVREFSEELAERGHLVSMNNIRYEARVSMDYAERLYDTRVPVPLHYGVDELYQVLSGLHERTRSIKLMSFDIEVASSTGGFPRPGDKVFLVSVCQGELGGEPECYLLEEDEVHDLVRVMERYAPSYLVGFNSSGFDIPYLRAFSEEARALGPWGLVTGSSVVPHIDLSTVLYQHGSSFGLPFGARLALDDVAARMGLASEDEVEVEASVNRSRIYEEYKRSPELVKRYALTDALLTFRVGKEVVSTLIYLYVLTGVAPSVIQVLPTVGALAEYAIYDMVRRRHGKVYALRSTKYTAREMEGWWGPYAKHTKEQFPGPMIARNVAEYDYNMLYPSIYYSDRLDPEGVEKAPPGKGVLLPLYPRGKGEPLVVHAVSKGGPVYEFLRYFYEARKTTKALKKQLGLGIVDQAVKILANSAYGMFSKTRGMGVNEVLGSWIFFRANQVLLTTIGFVEQALRRRVVYTATDAVFVELRDGDDPERLGELINRAVAAMHGEAFSVKLETVCRVLALLRRKTYVCVSDEETIVKGLEKLALPYAVKTSIEDVFRAELLEGRGVELLEGIFDTARLEDLFVKTSKRLVDLYNEDEGRFKLLNHSSLKATIIRWLYDSGSLGDGKVVVSLAREDLMDYPIISRWLGDSRLYVLLEAEGDEALVARCSLLEQRPGRVLEAVFRCEKLRLSRRDVARLARERSKVVYEYLGLIRKLRSGGLERYLGG